MGDFKFQQYVAPTQHIDTDTSGGDGGRSSSEANAYNASHAGDGGVAVGGKGGDGHGQGVGGRGGDSDADAHGGRGFFPWGDGDADSDGGNGGAGIGTGIGARGGDAEANGGHAATYGYTNSSSSADGGHGGPANVYASQSTPVNNDFRFENSFNEDNDYTYIKDSGNQDNDGVDNKGGFINHSNVAGGDIKDSGNSDDHTRIDHSFNTDNSHTNIDASDHSYHNDIKDSFNHEDNDLLDLDVRADHLLGDHNHLL